MPLNPIPTSNLSHYQLAKLYPGVTRNQLNNAILNQWHIPAHMHDSLDSYRISKISGELFSHQLKDGILALERSYQVIYQSCNPFCAKRAKKLKLSFRAAKPEFNIPPTVLVRIEIDMDGIREEN